MIHQIMFTTYFLMIRHWSMFRALKPFCLVYKIICSPYVFPSDFLFLKWILVGNLYSLPSLIRALCSFYNNGDEAAYTDAWT